MPQLVAYHFKVKFGCFGHLRDKCLRLGPLARNFPVIHETLRIWASLTHKIKTQHHSCHIHPPRAPELSVFRKAAYFTPACSQKPGWFPDLSAHIAAKNSLLLSSPRALRSIIGPGLHPLPQIQWTFPVSEWNEALPQPARIRGRTAGIYLLPRIIV